MQKSSQTEGRDYWDHDEMLDYFAAIRMLPDSQANPTSFRLVFQKWPEAGRFWKDLMVNIVQQIELAAQKTSIDLESKGEVEPIGS